MTLLSKQVEAASSGVGAVDLGKPEGGATGRNNSMLGTGPEPQPSHR
jgi:hypothetical protein